MEITLEVHKTLTEVSARFQFKFHFKLALVTCAAKAEYFHMNITMY